MCHGIQQEKALQTDFCHQQPEAAGERGEQQALGEQLTNQPSASGAQRQAHGGFLLSRHAAREQQIGDIDAGDQQQQADRGKQHQQRRVRMPGDLIAQRHQFQRHAAVRVGMIACLASGISIHLDLRLSQADAGFHAPDRDQPSLIARLPVGPARAVILRAKRQRQPDIGPANGKNAGHSALRGKSNSGGMMPISVRGSPLMAIGLPTSDGSPPKRRSQSPWLIRATGGPGLA